MQSVFTCYALPDKTNGTVTETWILPFYFYSTFPWARETIKSNAKLNTSMKKYPSTQVSSGRGSSIGSEFAWHASGPEFDPHVRHILSCRLGHENISTAILPLPLIQEEQLSVTGERMCTKYW